MLYTLLSNRPAINVLKALVDGPSHLSPSTYGATEGTLDFLESYQLLRRDASGLRISLRGKQVITLLDEMKDALEGGRQRASLKMDLKENELDTLLVVAHQKGSVPEEVLVEKTRKTVVSTKKEVEQILSTLKQLTLIEKQEDLIVLTPLGKKTAKQLLLEQFHL